MKRDVAMKWVKALRSGKYRQGKSMLQDNRGRFCCLGILQGPVLGMPIETREEVLSDEAKEAAGMMTCNGTPAFPAHIGIKRDGLADANDHGWNFSSIAAWIEKNWEHL